MPFNYSEYRAECKSFSDERLQQEYQKYVRISGSGSASAGIGIGLSVLTFGLSLVGTAASGAAIRNAYKKMAIIEEECQSRPHRPSTTLRKRDFLAGYGIGLTAGAVTHGAAGHLAGTAVQHATHHAAQHVATNTVQNVPSPGDAASHTHLTKMVEHGADKLGHKGSEKLEKRAYGVTVSTREVSCLEEYGDDELWRVV